MLGINLPEFFIIALVPLILSIGIAPVLSSAYVYDSPKQQMATGVALNQISCDSDKILMVSATGKPGCAYEDHVDKLVKYGWGTVVERDTTTPTITEQEDTRPNILFIILDDTGFADLSIKGSEIPTPAIDSLMADGTFLDNYRVQPACSPTRSILLSGVDNHLNGVGTMQEAIAENQKGKPGYETYLNDNVVTVATLLQDAGYHTILSGKWHLGLEHPYQPSDRGFDNSFSMLDGIANHFSDRPVFYNADSHYVLNGEPATLPSDFYSSISYTDYMIEQFDKNHGDGKPQFMYLSFTATHDPLMAPPEYIKKWEGVYNVGYDEIREQRLQTQIDLGYTPKNTPLIPLQLETPQWDSLNATENKIYAKKMVIFAAMLDLMDENIGRLLDHLKETGEYDNTLIYLASDNGSFAVEIEYNTKFRSGDDPKQVVEFMKQFDQSVENMGSENSFNSLGAGWAQNGNTPHYGFKLTTSEGGVHVPAIIKLPHQSEPETIEAFTTVYDIVPTVLDYANVEHPGTSYDGRDVYPLEGKSMRPLFEGDVDRLYSEDEPYAIEFIDSKSVYLGDWKIVLNNPPYDDGNWKMYNLADDPTESYDISKGNPVVFEKMKGMYDDYAKRVGVVPPIGFTPPK